MRKWIFRGAVLLGVSATTITFLGSRHPTWQDWGYTNVALVMVIGAIIGMVVVFGPMRDKPF